MNTIINEIGSWQATSVIYIIYYAIKVIKRRRDHFITLDFIGLIFVTQCLVAPVIAYTFFDDTNPLARLWKTVMRIDPETYFAFVLPAIIALEIGLCFKVLRNASIDHTEVFAKLRASLRANHVGIWKVHVFGGVLLLFVEPFVPTILQGTIDFFAQISFIGILAIYLSGSSERYMYLVLGIGLLVGQVVLSGMFTDVVTWLIITASIVTIGKTVSRSSILLVVAMICVGLPLLQSVKAEYRLRVWEGSERSSSGAEFANVLISSLARADELINNELVWLGINNRINHGAYVAKVMDFVPHKVDYAAGETVLRTIGGVVLPRFVWPGKPKTGGRENVGRFLHDYSSYKTGMSYNIGPLGEAYANFGHFGVILMFAYGLAFKFVFDVLLTYAAQYPLLPLYIPFVFISSIQAETDILTTWSGLFRGAVIVSIAVTVYRHNVPASRYLNRYAQNRGDG